MAKKYEEMIGDIEKLLDELNNKDLPLEEAVARYKEGLKLVETCQGTLDKVEKDLKIIENE